MEQFVYGVDVGGTGTKIGLFNGKGFLKDTVVIETRTENKGVYILQDIKAALFDNMNKHGIKPAQVKGVGVGVPGPVLSDGTVLKCVNLGWDVFNVAKQLQIITGLTVKAGNDANVAALGEVYRGGGQGYNSILLATLGTGIGGGVIINGKIVEGATGSAGEIGHITVNPSEHELCSCGRRGCFEQYASATGVVKLMKKYLLTHPDDSVLRSMEKYTAKEIYDAAKNGDAAALEVVKNVGEIMGTAFAKIATVLNPEAIVLGGGMAKAGQILIDSLLPSFKANVFHAAKNTDFKLATLGNLAGIYGSAKMIFDE
ncbi:MAG: ROK family glucokinase [Lachnospiraceae bacterium]|nr:ROK family glucokinase [Lachnospiraceae bacterium]MBR5789822.1 ROK family glucokinase [Lachnospiraceae bacterium]